MATFEVFVPVRGEVIYTIEADNATDAEDIVSTMDWSDGELNLAEDADSGTHTQLIAGDDAGMRYAQKPHAVYAGVDRSGYNTVEESTGRVYSMRHFNIASLV